MPVDCGSMTPSSAQAATAASAAVPPARITSTATSAAAGCEVATIAFWAWTVERPAKWKFLIRKLSFQRFLGGPHLAWAKRWFLPYSSRTGQWLVCQRFSRLASARNGGPYFRGMLLRHLEQMPPVTTGIGRAGASLRRTTKTGLRAPARLINGRHAAHGRRLLS